MTNELKRLEGMGKAFVKNIEDDVKFFDGHRYKVFRGRTTWHEAKSHCEDLGGYLAIIDNPYEGKFLVNMLSKGDGAFIGATDEMIDGSWLWLNGNKLGWSVKHPQKNYLSVWNRPEKKWMAKEKGPHTGGLIGWICEWE